MEATAIEGKKSTSATWLLIIACCVVYPFGLLNNSWACSYDNIFLYGNWWSVFTAVFVHGSIGHLLGNMLFLFLFGRGLERYIGSAGLIALFVASGAISMLLSVFYYPHNVPSVGASGAISAIMAALMLFNPWRLSLLLNMFPMPMGVAGFTFVFLNLGGFFSDRYNSGGGSHVAFLGHLLGFVVGIVFGMLLSPAWKKNLVVSVVQFVCFYLIVMLIMYYFRL